MIHFYDLGIELSIMSFELKHALFILDLLGIESKVSELFMCFVGWFCSFESMG
jgi:hypothetical protein